MPFRNRNEAARRLAERLLAYKGRNPLVLAIPVAPQEAIDACLFETVGTA